MGKVQVGRQTQGEEPMKRLEMCNTGLYNYSQATMKKRKKKDCIKDRTLREQSQLRIDLPHLAPSRPH
jgi:hypothetical protein